MSKESVEQFMQAAGLDAALQKKLEAAEGFAEVVEIGAEKGYQFTEEEVQAFLSERGITLEESQEGELSEAALDAVAGGWFENLRIRLGNDAPITIRQW
ncbi:Nif11-like leader peptide family natural product precursor [Brasilonema sp. UFV-L1]|uniref:Nif11-like leader peptide family natural product precursor n=1 Tax=Brasilonema sp. UFV-L1 TaxID=2234130 RepID=UPI00145E8403|nr:Nif11-like leader peptide family natural product precursor [Brasilonema sp. UFV-L1]